MIAVTRVPEQGLLKKILGFSFHSQTSNSFSSASSLQGRDPCEREKVGGWAVCPQVGQGSGFSSCWSLDLNPGKCTCGPS